MTSDMRSTLKWLKRGVHRLRVLKALAESTHVSACPHCQATDLTHTARGETVIASCPSCHTEDSRQLLDQTAFLTGLGLSAGSSAFGNGRQAIVDLIKIGFVLNESSRPRTYLLRINWNEVCVYSDWQEEHGLPRLDQELLQES